MTEPLARGRGWFGREAAKEAALKEGRPYGDPKKFDAEK